jgi:hypothetical protein
MKFIFLLIQIYMSSTSTQAKEIFEYQRPVRAYGAGGVHLPWAKETDAVLWNPALLGENTAIAWETFDLGAGANGLELYNLMKTVQSSGCTGSTCFSQYYGKPIHAGFHLKSAFVVPKFGVTGFNLSSLSGILNNPAFPTFTMTFLNDYGVAAGFGANVGEGLYFGATVKRISRWGGTQDLSLSTVLSGAQDIAGNFNQRGTGYGMDASLMYRSKSFGLQKITTVLHWQDIGSTSYVANADSSAAPARTKDNLSLGIGHELDLPGLDVRSGIEYRNITLQGEQVSKKLHLGVELGLPLVDFRLGVNQGYPTYGAGLSFLFMDLDIASYTEEAGVYPGQNPSARLGVSLSLSVSIDASFNVTSKDGKTRKLKQRR